MSKITFFINQYNLKEIDFPSYQRDWKKFELNNKSFVLNSPYIPDILILKKWDLDTN